MTKALAIARVTFAESMRRRTLFFLVVLWGVWAVLTFALPGVEAGHRVQIAFAGNLRAMSLFASLLAVLLVATSIPRDFEEKRIFLVLTKPIRAWDFFFGKFLGYAAFFAIVLGASHVFLSALVAFVFRDLPEGEKEARFYAHRPAAASGLEVRNLPGDDVLVPEGEGDSIAVDALHPRACWSFTGLDPEALPPGPLRGEIVLRFEPTGRRLQPGDRAPLRLRAIDPASGKSREIEATAVHGRPVVFEFPREVVGQEGAVDLVLERVDDRFDFLVRGADARLSRSREHYVANLGKAVLVVYLEVLVVVALGLMASSFLTGPVSVFSTLGLLVVGHCLEFLRIVAERLTSTEAVEDMWATLTKGHVHGGSAEAASEPTPFLEAVRSVVEAFCTVFPDFTRFQTSDTVAEGVSLSWSGIGSAALYSAAYVAVFLFAGWVLIATTDVDRREGPLVWLLSRRGKRRR